MSYAHSGPEVALLLRFRLWSAAHRAAPAGITGLLARHGKQEGAHDGFAWNVHEISVLQHSDRAFRRLGLGPGGGRAPPGQQVGTLRRKDGEQF